MATINELLQWVGLDAQETQLFLELLKNGPASPSMLARATGIHRATVYSVAKKLLARGLISEHQRKSGVHFQIGEPEQMIAMVKTEEKQLQDRLAIAGEIAKQLRNFASSGRQNLIPHYRVVSGEDIEKFLYDRAGVWDKSAQEKDGVWWGFQDEHFIHAHLDWLTWFWQNVHRDTFVRLFSTAQLIEPKLKGRYAHREIKILPESTFTATTWVMGNYIVQITSSENPSLIEIEQSALADNHRAVFQALWERVRS